MSEGINRMEGRKGKGRDKTGYGRSALRVTQRRK